MRILGVDPGSLVTGYGVIDAEGRVLQRVTSGIVQLRSGTPMPQRLATIYEGLRDVMLATHPDVFSIETAFYGKNVQSTLKLGQVRGVALLCAMHHGLDIREFSPREVKRAVTGTGAASKQQVAAMVRAMLALDDVFSRSDETDGLALALCCAVTRQLPPEAGAGEGRRGSKRRGSWEEFVRNNPTRVKS